MTSLKNSISLIAGSTLILGLAACGDTAETEATVDASAPEVAQDTASAVRIDCEPQGDAAVWIEKDAAGGVSYVTHMQSEMAPDAEAQSTALEATGMSAGRPGSRYSDESGNVIVWMLDDGTAEVTDNGSTFTCPSA